MPRDGSSGVEETFHTSRRPVVSSNRQTSVKVPPESTPTRQTIRRPPMVIDKHRVRTCAGGKSRTLSSARAPREKNGLACWTSEKARFGRAGRGGLGREPAVRGLKEDRVSGRNRVCAPRSSGKPPRLSRGLE